MTTNLEVLERKSGGISNSVFEGTAEQVQNWMNKNTMILKNRGIFTDISNLDCQTKYEFDMRIEIRISSDAALRLKQIKENGTLSTYRFVNAQ